jgi:hypothetical protein
MNILRFVLMGILAFGVGAGAEVSKKPVKLNDLPAEVRKTVERQKGAANILRLEKFEREGSQMYELEFSSGGSAVKTVLIDAAGKIVEIKEPIKLSEVSKAAKAVIESSVGDGHILSLDSVKTASGIISAYEVRFRREGKESLLRIGPDGSLVQE